MARRWQTLGKALALFTATATLAQSFPVTVYTEDDGLPSSSVYDIAQDQAGRLWFATRSGVAVYDGFAWRRYTTGEGLPYLNCIQVSVDEDDVPWALSLESILHVSYLKDGAWRPLPQPQPSIRGNAESLLKTVREDDGQTAVAISGPDGMSLWRRQRWQAVVGAPEGPLIGLEAHDGRFVAATAQRLFSFENGVAAPLSPEGWDKASGPIWAIKIEKADAPQGSARLWLWRGDTLGYAQDGAFAVVARIAPPAFAQVRPFFFQPAGPNRFIFGTTRNIFEGRIDGNSTRLRQLGLPEGLSFNGLTALFRDRENVVWFASSRGLNKAAHFRFDNWTTEDGMEEGEVTAIEEWSANRLLLGHNRGVSFFDVASGRFRYESFPDLGGPPSETRVMDLAAGPNGAVWIAANALGVGRMSVNGVIEWRGEEAGLSGKAASLLPNDDGSVWVGAGGGLFLLKDGRFLTTAAVEGSRFYVRRLARDQAGRIYAAVQNFGIAVKEGNAWRWLKLPTKRQNPYSLLVDRRDRLWVGASNGLYSLEDGALTRCEIPGADLNRPVFFIAEDPSGWLWLGTDNGVFRWDMENGVRHYTKSEGLAGRETNRDAGFIDSDGALWIGMDTGLSRYNPDMDPELDAYPPPLARLDRVEVGERSLPLDRPIELSSHDNNLFFHFACASFLDENAILFQHQLKGFEDGWQTPEPFENRAVRYTNLPPGVYHMRARFQNALGVWSEPIVSAPILIRLPFWRQWWFIALIALAVFGLLIGFERFWNVKRRSIQLKRQVAIQTRELREKNAALNRELTERKAIETELSLAKERAESANQAKSHFLATMSHEIRTPLNGVIATASLMNAMGLNVEQRQCVDMIRVSGEALLAVINDILDFSKIESGKIELTHEPFSVRQTVKEVMDILESKAAERAVSLSADIHPDTPPWAAGDNARLRQVLLNLVGNAVKFTRKGRAQIIVSPLEKAAGMLHFRVADTGIGIAADRLHRLFEPFSQADSSTSREFGGTGLGLAIAKRLTSLMGGDIWAESQVGRGSVFHFTIAAAAVPSPAPALTEVAPQAIRNGQFAGLRALVAEDNAINQKIIGRFLEKLGIDTALVENGRQALSALEQNTFDLILMDVQMPVMDGLTAAREIIRRWGADRPYIIACTANAMAEDRAACAAAGMDGFIAKPILFEDLVKALEQGALTAPQANGQ